jgi:hypothetical protein
VIMQAPGTGQKPGAWTGGRSRPKLGELVQGRVLADAKSGQRGRRANREAVWIATTEHQAMWRMLPNRRVRFRQPYGDGEG